MKTSAIRPQAGFTIAELMVALAVGLVIIAGVGQVFISNKNAYRYIDGVSTLQEQANYALDFVSQQANAAGFVPDAYKIGTNLDTKVQIESLAYGKILPIDGTEGGTDSDTLIINTIPSAPVLLDCTNAPVAAAFTALAGRPGVTNTLDIQTGESGQPALFCNGIEIVEGVENMQVLYGRSTVNGTGQRVIQYFRRDELGDNDMLEVVNLRIALLVSTVQERRPGENPDNTYDLLGTSVAAPTDRRMRQVVSTTIRLRNRCQTLPPTSGATICT